MIGGEFFGGPSMLVAVHGAMIVSSFALVILVLVR